MAKKKVSADKADKKNSLPFALAVGFLGGAIVMSIALFIVSLFINSDSQEKLNESMYPIKYEYYVESYAKEFDVDVCLVYGVIRTESGFDPEAVSGAGAIGLMQIMPDTFTWLQNYRTDFMPDKLLDSSELYKPQVNIEYGTYMLSYLLDHYDGNTSLAIIAYNAGYGNVDNWLADGTISHNVTSDTVPFTETANYLDRVTTAMNMYKSLYYDELLSSQSSADTETESDTDSQLFLPTTDTADDDYTGESYAEDNYTGESSADEYSNEEYYTDNGYYAADEYYTSSVEEYAYEGDGAGVTYSDDWQ